MSQQLTYPVVLTGRDLTLLVRLLAVEAFDKTMAQVQDDAEEALDLLIRLQWAQFDLTKHRDNDAVNRQASV